jgi:lysozyme family protein
MNNKDIIKKIIKREGGFINHSADRGGATNFGITIKTLSDYRGKPQTIEDVKNLELEEAYKIYEEIYILKPKFNLIADKKLKELVVDAGVHSGTTRATLWLQEAVKVKTDGILGNVTLNAVNQNSSRVYLNFLAIRIKFLGGLITKDPKQAVFASGWFNRVAEFLER